MARPKKVHRLHGVAYPLDFKHAKLRGPVFITLMLEFSSIIDYSIFCTDFRLNLN